MKSYLYNLPKYKANNARPRLLRVIIGDKYTRLDFGYQSNPIYIRGGWVTIAPETFLRVNGSDDKFVLTHADNIPLAPDKHYFQSNVDNLSFTLYFPQLPEKTIAFDLIEKEPAEDTFFNYYDIRLKPGSAIQLR